MSSRSHAQEKHEVMLYYSPRFMDSKVTSLFRPLDLCDYLDKPFTELKLDSFKLDIFSLFGKTK